MWKLNFVLSNFVGNQTCDYKSLSRFRVVRFCYHTFDFSPNYTPLSSITVVNRKAIECDSQLLKSRWREAMRLQGTPLV